MEFNKYCNETVLMFDGDKKGLNLYLSDNEIILSVKKIKNGNFLIPTEIQKELIVQTILKNEKEIISMGNYPAAQHHVIGHDAECAQQAQVANDFPAGRYIFALRLAAK